MALYKNQKGSIDGKHFVDIRRGVKQGDTLSAMLFNVGIEEAFIQWKAKLTFRRVASERKYVSPYRCKVRG